MMHFVLLLVLEPQGGELQVRVVVVVLYSCGVESALQQLLLLCLHAGMVLALVVFLLPAHVRRRCRRCCRRRRG